MISSIFFQNLAAALGSTVIHSVWQIALVWLVYLAVRSLLKTPQAVHGAALLAMFSAFVWAAATFSAEFSEAQNASFLVENQAAKPAAFSIDAAEKGTFLNENDSKTPFFEKMAVSLERNSALVGWAWLVIFSLFWLRILGGFWLSQKIRNAPAEPIAPELFDLFERLKKRLRAPKNTRLFIQKSLAEPVALGFFRPVVLFPAACLTQLSTAQIEALLLHELAHLRRHDYFFNLIQIALEAVFFYHPLFWMLSKTARAEREMCCDDLVLSQKTDRLAYAKALTDLQILPIFQQNRLAMTAVSNGKFGHRIARIMGVRPEKSSRQPLFLLGFLTACAMFLGFAFKNENGLLVSKKVEKAAFFAQTDANSTLENQKDTLPPASKRAEKQPEFSIHDFQNMNGIEAAMPDFPLEAEAEIADYSIGIVVKGEDPVEWFVEGPDFPSGAKNLLQKLTTGSLVFFDKIRCRVGSETELREIGSLVFTFKD